MLKPLGAIVLMLSACLAFTGCKANVDVPDLSGKTQADATAALLSMNLAAGTVTTEASATVASGLVISQVPGAHSLVVPGSSVDMVISSGSSSVTVPNVVGLAQSAATSALQAVNLSVGSITEQSSTTVAAGHVISQSPAANSTVAPNSAVNLVVSAASNPVLGWTYIPSVQTVWLRSISTTLSLPDKTPNGYILAGGHNGDNDMYALKLSISGAKVWDNTYTQTDGQGGNLWGSSACGAVQHNATAGATGNFVVLSRGRKDINDTHPEESYLQILVDTNGNRIDNPASYAPYIPGSTTVYATANMPAALALASDDGQITFGSSDVSDYPVASILKTSATGHATFVKVVNDNGGDYDEQITGGQITQDNGSIMVGYSAEFGPDFALLIKLDSSGGLVWSKKYQDLADNYGADGWCVVQTSADQGYVFGGQLVGDLTKISTYGGFLAKASASGDPVWFHSLKDTVSLNYVTCAAETPQGDIVVAGDSSLALDKFDKNGTFIWEFPESALPSAYAGLSANALVLTNDGGCIVVASRGQESSIVYKVNHVFAVE